nr:ribonuclease H-like domain, reverse transcriptase, RNA-dependent DNA polymerase [Tanacetum cinerariifolium]
MQEELLQFKLQKGYIQEEGIDYDEVFALVARIKAIWLFLAYASFMGFMVYQIYVKSSFLYERIKEEVYVCQPLGFEDPDHSNKVYKVVKALYGLHQALRACTPVDTEKPFVKDAYGDDIDVYLYRSMIGSLMYLTTSRPDIIYCLFELVVYTDSDYVGVSLDRKSTTRGCQFLGSRFISWHCKKQTMVATSTTEAKYVAVASFCGQVL